MDIMRSIRTYTKNGFFYSLECNFQSFRVLYRCTKFPSDTKYDIEFYVNIHISHILYVEYVDILCDSYTLRIKS